MCVCVPSSSSSNHHHPHLNSNNTLRRPNENNRKRLPIVLWGFNEFPNLPPPQSARWSRSDTRRIISAAAAQLPHLAHAPPTLPHTRGQYRTVSGGSDGSSRRTHAPFRCEVVWWWWRRSGRVRSRQWSAEASSLLDVGAGYCTAAQTGQTRVRGYARPPI